MAEALARDGYRVTATGLTSDEVSAARAADTPLDIRQVDVTDPQAIANLVASFSRLDLLINAAGTILRERREHTPEGFEQVVDVNLHGTMRMCYAARELLERTQGSVINVASMLSYFGSPHVPGYSASKGGIVQLTKSLAIAWAPRVRVNAIAPGWIETALTQPLHQDPARRADIIARTPLGRWGQPEDVCGAALFLASPAARFITGVVLPVDGGYSIA